MTGCERILRLLDGQPVDRTPVMASFIAAGAAWRAIPQRRLHQESDTNASVLLECSRELGLDGAYISSDNWVIHSALGGQIDFPEDDEPWGRGPVLDDWARLEELSVPDPERDGRMPFMLAAARKAVEISSGELLLEANIDSGPFQLAGILRGAQQLMSDVVLAPGQVHRLLEFCTDVVRAYGVAMARTGVDAVQFGDSTASLVSRETYVEFVKPYQRPAIDAIRDAGAHPFLHVCGDSSHLSDELAESGAACVEIDSPADLGRTMAQFRDRAVVRGNVSTVLIQRGPVEDIKRAARECLAAARGSG